MTESGLGPIERSISVSWAPAAAFARFTRDFALWWPVRTHSIGGDRVARIVFETQVGGRIFEEHRDGRRFQWGRVHTWEPPHRVCFSWHPSRDPQTAQDVEVRFEPAGTGTRLVLVATGWEKWGAGARRARRGYHMGWGYVLQVCAGRRTAGMRALDVVASAANLAARMRGGTERAIARAGGEMRD